MAAEFDTHQYEFAHGRKPRGTGSWAFAPADYDYREIEAVPDDGIAWGWGLFSDAKREVALRFPSVPAWTVLP